MSKESKRRHLTALSQVLKIYRESHKFNQEELANLLDVDPRTLRRWENGETILNDVHELKRIADRLGTPYEYLGIASSVYIPLTIEQINTGIDTIWNLISEGHIREARSIATNLTLQASYQSANMRHDEAYLQALTMMHHAAGHATSLNVRTNEVSQALYQYQQMEYFARQLQDDTLLNIALTYQGDMMRRKGDFESALAFLEAARDTTPLADISSKGNNAQLLARTYWQTEQFSHFDATIKEAEEFAHHLNTSPSVKQFNLSYVYEEYAKSYGRSGQTQLALDYIERAEREHFYTTSSAILFKVTRAEILVHAGDIQNALPLALEAALYSREHEHHRRLERIYAIKHAINQQALKYSKAVGELSEALDGPIER